MVFHLSILSSKLQSFLNLLKLAAIKNFGHPHDSSRSIKVKIKGLVHQILQESSYLFVRTVHIVLSLQIVQQNVPKRACQEIFLLANPRLPQPDYLLRLNLVVTTSWGSYQPL